LTTYDSKGTRLTCVTLADGDMDIDGTVNGKRKREDENADEDEDGLESDQEILDSSIHQDEEDEMEAEAKDADENQSHGVTCPISATCDY
jgi:protein MAK11